MSAWRQRVDGHYDRVEQSLSIEGINAEIHSYEVLKEVEYAVSADKYFLAYLISRPKHYRHTRWRVFDNDRIYQPSKLTLLPSGVPMLAHSTPARTRALICEIDRHLFEDVTGVTEWPQERIARAMESANSSCQMLLMRFAAEVLDPGFASDELVNCLTRCLMIELGHELELNQADDASGSRLADWQLRRIDEHIYDFSSDRKRIKISVLADSCGISDRHLMRSFKQATGVTIFRYMENIRLEETKRLLRESKMPMKTIATQMGFSSSAHLSSAFKQLCDMTPTDYRRRLDS